MSSDQARRMERADRLRTACGVNYLPSWAPSSYDHWGPRLDPDRLAVELGLARAMGFDHVRVWLSAPAWERTPPTCERNLRLLADTAHATGLGLVVQLFDSCGVELDEPVHTETRIEDIPLLAPGDSRTKLLQDWQANAAEPRDIFPSPALVPVAWRGDPVVAIWEGWSPSPGYSLLGPSHRNRWEAYARAMLGVLADHPALWLCEVMNEPFMTHIGSAVDHQPIIDFYRWAHALARRLAPSVPLAIGAQCAAHAADHDGHLTQPQDVVSFHCYDGAEAIANEIETARAIAGDRPVYLSEWGWFPGADDARQLAGFEQRLPAVDQAGVGFAVFHLLAGYGPFGLSALLYPSGIMRPAARLLRGALTRPLKP
jgi:hypothetical protein